MRFSRHLIGGSLVLAISLAAGALSAQSPPPPVAPDPRADALFKEARALIAQGNWEDACPKLEQSRQIQAGMGTIYNLADCYEHIGRTASAWAGFMDVAAAADAAGQSPRAHAARERAVALAAKLPKLRIVVSPDLAQLGVDVRRDGVPVGSLVWGTDVPVDPGRHRIIVSAPGKSVWSSAVDLMEPGKVVVVTVPPLRPEGEAAPDPPSTVTEEPSAPARPGPDHPAGRSIAPAIALGGGAVAGIGVGIGLLVASSGKSASAASLRTTIQGGGTELNGCLASPKPADCDGLDSEVRGAATMRGVAIGAFIVGGLAAAGMAVYLLAPSSSKSPSRAALSVRIAPTLGPASGGVDISGSF